MSIRTESFIAPAHWATALMYGDYSGIDDDNEAKRIERFEASLPGAVTDVVDVGFMLAFGTDTPDQLAGDYAEYTCLINDNAAEENYA